jgi:hypothetical protein
LSLQLSASSQLAPSAEGCGLQLPSLGSHTPLLQASPAALQSFAALPRHSPFLHWSLLVQASTSSQDLSLFWFLQPSLGSQLSSVHAFLSSQSRGSVPF